MAEYYAELRWMHIGAVIVSGLLFTARGSMVLADHQRIAMLAPLRYLSYAVDTVLLTAALLLSLVVRQYPFVHAWLTAKVLLLAIYIVLGSLALKRAPTRRLRALCFVGAVLVFLFIVTVARTHHPIGVLRPLLG